MRNRTPIERRRIHNLSENYADTQGLLSTTLVNTADSQAAQPDWAVGIVGAPSTLLLAVLARCSTSK